MAIYQWGSGPCGCVDTQGVLSLPEGGALAIEPDPAESGDIRLPNGGTIKARNAADDGDIVVVATEASDAVLLGDTAQTTVVRAGPTDTIRLAPGSTVLEAFADLLAISTDTAIGSGTKADTGTIRLATGASIKARNAAQGADVDVLSKDASDFVQIGGANAVEVRARAAGTLALRATSGLVASQLPLEVNAAAGPVASSGDLRLRNALDVVKGLTNAGADVSLLGIDSANVVVGGSGAAEVRLRVGAEDQIRALADRAIVNDDLAVGASGGTVATTGTIRLANTAIIKARNAGDDGDVDLLSSDAGSRAVLGGASSVARLASPSGVPADTTREFAVGAALGTYADAGDLRLRYGGAIFARNQGNNGNVRIAIVTGTNDVVLGHGDGTGASLSLDADGSATLGGGGAGTLSIGSSLISVDRDLAIGSGTVASSGAVRLANDEAVMARKAGVAADVALVGLNSSNEVVLGDGWARLGSSYIQSDVPSLRWATSVASPTISQNADNTASAVGDTLTVVAQECVGDDGIGGNLHLRPGRGITHGALELQDGLGNERLTVGPTGDVTVDVDATFLLRRDGGEVLRVEDSLALNALPIKSTVASSSRTLLWTMTPTSPTIGDHVVRLYRHTVGLEVTVNAAWSGTQWEKDTATRASRLSFQSDRLALHFHNTTTQTFTDAAWTGSFSQFPDTGAAAFISSAAELQGPGQTEAYVGQQCRTATSGNTNIGSGCTFRKRFPATPSTVTVTAIASSGITSGPFAYQARAYGTGAYAGTGGTGGTAYFYALVQAS